jgi:hypothetical protein
MNRIKYLENRIRGWLPKKPKLSSQNSPIQTPIKPKPLPKRKLSVLWIIAVIVIVYSYMFSFLFQFSTLSIILIMVTLAFAVSWVLFRRISHKNIIRFLKYALILILLFVVSFTSAGFYLFYTSGYPPTYVPEITYPNILDASLTQYLESLQQSASFRFLQAEHFGSLAFAELTIRTSYSNAPEGWFMWTFYAEDVKTKITVGETSGKPYFTDSFSPLSRTPFPQNLPSSQSVNQIFNQIDALGLRWYYNQAIEAIQNKTTTDPTVSELGVNIAFDSLDNYQGITIALTGFNVSYDNFGNKVYPTIFKATFETNGNILSVTT